MKELFNLNSPWVQRFAMLTNLVMLNILWLICCIPIFTAGAATSALYYTVFRYHNKEDDAVLRPFFHAFRVNFRQATLLLLPLLALLALLAYETLYLVSHAAGTAVLFLLIIVAVLLTGILVHLFPLIARFEMRTTALLRTAFSLTLLHLPATLLVIALAFLPFFLLFLFPAQFLQFGAAWAGIWYALIAYLFGRFLLKIWSRHTRADE